MNQHRLGLRAGSALLWFLVGLATGNCLASMLGTTPAAGPLLGTALAALVAGDPFHLLWWPKAGARRALEAAAKGA